MDKGFSDMIAQRATQRCKDEFKEIEKGLSPCFQTNPGTKLTKARQQELLDMIEWVEQQQACGT